jgi:benzoate/toluate 1,2-dioxygenase alpha subunit
VGESAVARATRIRQYEDFFNASGMATPDDLTEFESCQTGFARGTGHFNDMSRGSTRWVPGVSQEGQEIGVNAIQSGTDVADEGLYLAIHENWLRTMQNAVGVELARTSKETIAMQGAAL